VGERSNTSWLEVTRMERVVRWKRRGESYLKPWIYCGHSVAHMLICVTETWTSVAHITTCATKSWPREVRGGPHMTFCGACTNMRYVSLNFCGAYWYMRHRISFTHVQWWTPRGPINFMWRTRAHAPHQGRMTTFCGAYATSAPHNSQNSVEHYSACVTKIILWSCIF
jgi:hypothetical protein